MGLKIQISSKSDFIYLLEGDLLWGAPTNQVECYSLRQKTWQYAPPMRDGRMFQSAVAPSDDTIVVCGGILEPWYNSSCEIFSLITKGIHSTHHAFICIETNSAGKCS